MKILIQMSTFLGPYKVKTTWPNGAAHIRDQKHRKGAFIPGPLRWERAGTFLLGSDPTHRGTFSVLHPFCKARGAQPFPPSELRRAPARVRKQLRRLLLGWNRGGKMKV